MALTLFSIENAKTRPKSYALADGFGLQLLVKPRGKLWRFRYRFARKANMLGLGAFPEVSLAEAREKRDDARKLLRAGTDPSQKKKADQRAAKTAQGNTFGLLVKDHLVRLQERARRRPRSRKTSGCSKPSLHHSRIG